MSNSDEHTGDIHVHVVQAGKEGDAHKQVIPGQTCSMQLLALQHN